MWCDYTGKCPICAGVTYGGGEGLDDREECVECGWYRETIPHFGYLTFDELQQLREDRGLPPLDPDEYRRTRTSCLLPDMFEGE